MKLVYPGSIVTVFTPPVIAGTGDVKAGTETANRQPPAYAVIGRSARLAPSAVGVNSLFRNTLAQATAQAFKSWIPSQANQKGD